MSSLQDEIRQGRLRLRSIETLSKIGEVSKIEIEAHGGCTALVGDRVPEILDALFFLGPFPAGLESLAVEFSSSPEESISRRLRLDRDLLSDQATLTLDNAEAQVLTRAAGPILLGIDAETFREEVLIEFD